MKETIAKIQCKFITVKLGYNGAAHDQGLLEFNALVWLKWFKTNLILELTRLPLNRFRGIGNDFSSLCF